MSAQDAMEHFVEPMKRIVAGTPGSDPEAFFVDLCNLLSDFSVDALQAGYRHLAKTWPKRYWPIPSECIAACRSATQQKRAVEPAMPKHMDLSPEATQAVLCAQANRAITRQAIEQGWILNLRGHAQEGGRMPSPPEAAEMRDAARKFDVLEAEGFPGTMKRTLERVAKVRSDRKKEIADALLACMGSPSTEVAQ